MMTAATLFSGIGAPETAMPEWRWPWHAEIERFPAAVLEARHPASINLGDVSADDFADRAAAIACPDVLVFGSPCQSFSIAGKRLGLDDKRGNLALVALGIVARLKPRWFVFENVPGLLSSGDGRDFGAFVGTVDELGYSGAWASLDAQWFGVAQRRERLFFVGHLGDWRRAAAVLLEPESLCGDHPPRRQAREKIAGTLTSSLGRRGGQPNDDNPADFLVARSLNAHAGRIDGESETFIAHALRAEGFDASEDGTGRGTPLVAFSSKDHGADAGAIAPTLRAMGHVGSHANAGGQLAVAFQSVDFGADASVELSPTIRRHDPMAAMIGSAVRRLTPRECERLQGFPDDYTLIQYRGKPAADGPRYKALGNSMAVPVMRWILSRIALTSTQSESN
jgi:DNA (cytosine-5)-methyltransferase 1